jgi:hypothetical protein
MWSQIMFDLKNYEPVENRIRSFYEKYESGRIITELIAYSDNQFIVKASVYRNDTDSVPATTGYAEERVGSSPVNRTSALENCETSAIGRALANLNFAPKGARPSKEEMQKTARYEVANGQVPKEAYKESAQGAWADVGQITEKQVSYVQKIIDDASSSSGIKGDLLWEAIREWLNSSKRTQPITKTEDLTKLEASKIINDKRSGNGQKQSRLVEFLITKLPADYDPWATPIEG